MNTQLHTSVISVFFNFYSPTAWNKLREAFVNHSYKKVYVIPTVFKENPDVEVKGKIDFNDPDLLKVFLESEHDSAIKSQNFELAAEVSKLQKSSNEVETVYKECSLKFSLTQVEKGVCNLQFETNIFTFKNRLIEEYISSSVSSRDFGWEF